ncbi:uncharacterized protein METZ01_LOCUS474294 [marine metagenome]|jgi:hypothetical protein|uniref:Uncharacterized protein n=1 Tax=marine metagenome TaxID=408172 RepID=A0A383BNP6_9ZZZZ
MTRLRFTPFVAGILVIAGLFFASWLVTQATAADLKEGPGMDVPEKGTTNEYWAEWYGPHPYIKEPAPKFISRWEINEVPRNVTVYYDVNGDGFHDIVFAHPIVAENHAPACAKIPRPEQKHHWMFTTCPQNRAADYFVVREYTMFRILNQRTCSGCPLK